MLPSQIERGRLAFENLKKIVSYLIPAGSFSEATPIIANVFLGMWVCGPALLAWPPRLTTLPYLVPTRPLPLSPFLMIIICMLTDVSG
jgi:sodium/potassium-transporting ATPase subunit alpha